MPRRKRFPLLFGVYDAFKADGNDDGWSVRQANRLSCADPHCPVENRRVAGPFVVRTRVSSKPTTLEKEG